MATTDEQGREVFGAELYGPEAEGAPDAAVAASLGCGVPTAVADLHPGEVVLDLGSGAGADCQYLFAEDILGENTGHVPRHSKVYRNFAAEYERLQAERVAAFGEFVGDVAAGAYPEARHEVATDPGELRRFVELAEAERPRA